MMSRPPGGGPAILLVSAGAPHNCYYYYAPSDADDHTSNGASPTSSIPMTSAGSSSTSIISRPRSTTNTTIATSQYYPRHQTSVFLLVMITMLMTMQEVMLVEGVPIGEGRLQQPEENEHQQQVKTFPSHFYFKREATIVTSFTGSISAVSSAFIMYIVLRSQSKLSSTYHRIMFFMSFCDFVLSLAIALVTIPMPREILFPFETPSFGNTTTCSTQGFLAYVGSILVILCNCTLSLYYVCNLRYKMTDETMNRCLLPIMAFMSVIFAIVPGVIFLSHDLINPQAYDAYCKIGAYPYYCIFSKNIECQRGQADSPFIVFMIVRYLFIVIISGFAIVTLSMAIIVLSVCNHSSCSRMRKQPPFYYCLLGAFMPINQATMADATSVTTTLQQNCDTTQQIASSSSLKQDDDLEEGDRNSTGAQGVTGGNRDREVVARASTTGITDRHLSYFSSSHTTNFATCTTSARDAREVNIITFQALLYVLTFLLTWIFTILVFVTDSDAIRYMKIIFQPLQGFFNALIFVHHRLYNLRRSSPEMGLLEAFLKSVRDPKCVPEEFISSIDIVDMNHMLSLVSMRNDVNSSSSNHVLVNDVNSSEEIINALDHDGEVSENSNKIPWFDSISVQMNASVGHSLDPHGISLSSTSSSIHLEQELSPGTWAGTKLIDLHHGSSSSKKGGELQQELFDASTSVINKKDSLGEIVKKVDDLFVLTANATDLDSSKDMISTSMPRTVSERTISTNLMLMADGVNNMLGGTEEILLADKPQVLAGQRRVLEEPEEVGTTRRVRKENGRSYRYYSTT